MWGPGGSPRSMQCSADVVGRHGSWSSVCHVNSDTALGLSEHQSLQREAGGSGIMAWKPPSRWPSAPHGAHSLWPRGTCLLPPPPALPEMTFTQSPGSLQAVPSTAPAIPLASQGLR